MKITEIAMKWKQFKTDMWFYNLFCAIEDAIRKNRERIGIVTNRAHRNEKSLPRIERRLLVIEEKLGIEPRPSSQDFKIPIRDDKSKELLKDEREH